MKIVFDGKRISIFSDKKLIVDRNKMVIEVLNENWQQEVYFDSEAITLNVTGSLKIEEVYRSVSNLDYRLNIKENSQVENVCFIEVYNEKINKLVNLEKSATLEQIVVDLVSSNYDFTSKIEINGEHCSCYSRVATISNNVSKKIKVLVNHNCPNGESKLDNYGVVANSGELIFEVVGAIKKGAKNSKVLQNNKIILFDELSKGETRPYLYIDENDVQASHAAAVGKVDDNHIYYLCSRGINWEEAKKTIALGYLKPVLEYINDRKDKEKLLSLMEKEVI